MIVDNKDARLYHLLGVTLMPGQNDVPQAKWDALLSNVMVKALLASGSLVASAPMSPAMAVLEQVAELAEAPVLTEAAPKKRKFKTSEEG